MYTHGMSLADDPFDGDQAAQHHLLENGWMWMLRFSEGTTSLGIVQPTSRWLGGTHPGAVQDHWNAMISRYPTLVELLRNARLIAPCQADGVPRLGWLPRLSRLWAAAAGAGWAMLPGTAGNVDALHSTGIAHGLSGVWRLATLLLEPAGTRDLALQLYSREVVQEVLWIDRIISTCYAAAEDSFELFCAACSLYFVSAVHSERQLATKGNFESGFLLSQDSQLRQVAHAAELRIVQHSKSDGNLADKRQQRSELIDWLRVALQPWNDIGLLDATVHNRIWRSAAHK